MAAETAGTMMPWLWVMWLIGSGFIAAVLGLQRERIAELEAANANLRKRVAELESDQ